VKVEIKADAFFRSQNFFRGNPAIPQREMNRRIVLWIEENFQIGASTLISRPMPDPLPGFRMGIHNSNNMREVKGPYYHKLLVCSGEPPAVHSNGVVAVKVADSMIFDLFGVMRLTSDVLDERVFLPSKRFPNPHFKPDSSFKTAQGGTQIPHLWILAARQVAEYNRIFGETNGRPHAIHALENLDKNNKYQDTLLLKDQMVSRLTEEQRFVVNKLERALDLHHSLLGTDKYIGKIPAKLDPRSLRGLPLHSSQGSEPGIIQTMFKDGITYILNPRGKKYENYESTIKELYDHIKNRKPIYISWEISPKHEMKFSTEKQKDDETYRKWRAKHRIFEIPRAIYVYMERLVLFVRKILENNTRIKIGHKWPRGGADFLFRGLGLDGVFGDGDFEKFDQSIHAFFTNLFYSTMMIYYGDGPDREEIKWICEQLARNCVSRISHLYDEIWAEVIGGLPSGAFSTSNCGSWILHLLFCLFLISVVDDFIAAGNRVMVRRVERTIHSGQTWIVVYGDDHVVSTPLDLADVVGEGPFAEWTGRVWGMRIRDLRTKVKLLSQARNGELQYKGIVFLKQYFVECDLPIPNPPKMVPFRPKSEVCYKAVWGLSGQVRTESDMMLSALGIAYTMMGVMKLLIIGSNHFLSF